MKLDNLPFNSFDVFLLVWVTMGIFRGRKRGMSEELITFFQWIGIVAVGAIAYRPLGYWVQSTKVLGPLASYVISYFVIAMLVWGVAMLLKRALGGKLMGSDAFGKSEYYLGMPAGMLRYVCMLLAGLAILNARFYSREEIAAYHKFQQDNYGSDFFPGLQALQATVFEESIAGPPIRKYLGFLLIQPTAPEGDKRYKQRDWAGPS